MEYYVAIKIIIFEKKIVILIESIEASEKALLENIC